MTDEELSKMVPDIEPKHTVVKEIKSDKEIDSSYIYSLLLKKFDDGQHFACAGEVGDTTCGSNRRLDFVAVDCWYSGGLKIHAFEIKVSKADLKRELMSPEKHNIFFDNIDTYSIVTPEKVIDADLIPKNWGIYVVKDGKLVTKRNPIALHDERKGTMNRAFATSLIRSISKQSHLKAAINDLLYQEYLKGKEEGKQSIQEEYRRVQEYKVTSKWKIDFCHDAGIYSEEEAKKYAPLIKKFVEGAYEMEYMKGNLKRSIQYMDGIKAALQKQLEDVEKITGNIEPEKA